MSNSCANFTKPVTIRYPCDASDLTPRLPSFADVAGQNLELTSPLLVRGTVMNTEALLGFFFKAVTTST